MTLHLAVVAAALLAVYTAWVAANLAWYGWRRGARLLTWQRRWLITRRCPEAHRIHGPVIYVYFWFLFVIYVGQSRAFGGRMTSEARMFMAPFITHTVVLRSTPEKLSRTEHALIRNFQAKPLGFNRDEGHR